MAHSGVGVPAVTRRCAPVAHRPQTTQGTSGSVCGVRRSPDEARTRLPASGSGFVGSCDWSVGVQVDTLRRTGVTDSHSAHSPSRHHLVLWLLRSVSSAVCVCRVLSACWALRPTGRPRGLRYGLFSHDSPFRFPSGFSIYTLSRAFSRAVCHIRVLIPLPLPPPLRPILLFERCLSLSAVAHTAGPLRGSRA